MKQKLTTARNIVLTLIVAVASGTIVSPAVSAQTTCSTTTAPATTYGQVKQPVSVATAGTYRVWSRIKTADTTNNSYYLQVDSGCAINVGDATSIPANTWTWVNYQSGSTSSISSVSLTAGAHNLTYTGREANVQLDRVLFLSDTTCVPTGTGDNCVVTTTPGTDTTAPTVSLAASPSNIALGQSATLTATASDAGGVTKVEFYTSAGVLISTDTSAPYTTTWAPSTTGTKTPSAKAYDAAGNVGTATATFTVGSTTTPPPPPPPTPTPTPTPPPPPPSTTPIPGDANGDGRVNGLDYSILASHDGENYPAADFNKDGTVGAADLAILLAKWTW